MSNPLPTALDLKELVRTPANASTILRVATLNALYTACISPTTIPTITTGSISEGSATQSQINAIIAELRQMGFVVNEGTGSFTVTFQR